MQENIIREIYIKYTALCCVCHEHSSARNHCRRRRRQQFCVQMGRAVTFHDTFNRVRCFFFLLFFFLCVCYVSVENHFIGWIINSCDNIWCFHMCQKKGIYLCLVHPASITPPPTPYSNRGCNSPYIMMRPHYTQKNRNRTKKKNIYRKIFIVSKRLSGACCMYSFRTILSTFAMTLNNKEKI